MLFGINSKFRTISRLMKGTDLFKRFHSSVGCKTKTEDAKKIQKPINQWSNQNTEQTVASAREKSGSIYY